MEVLFKKESYSIIGAAMEVHRTLGKGFLESVYQESLGLEFNKRQVPFSKEQNLELFYKGEKLSKYFVADFICFDKIILELKSVSFLTNDHEAQVFNYLKATKLNLALLINFGANSLQYKRIVLWREKKVTTNKKKGFNHELDELNEEHILKIEPFFTTFGLI